jgi:hypothetical protein
MRQICQARGVAVSSLAHIAEAIRESWSPKTCDPVDLDDWAEENPSRGQCAVTALVVHDLLGGELLLAEVRHSDGTRQGVHYWNRLDDGAELDLTRDQFTRGEIIGSADIVPRPKDIDHGRLAEQYRTLSERVSSRLPQ